jgi:hypothetical protein
VTDQPPQEGELILCRTADETVRIEALYKAETFWLDRRRLAELFGIDVRTVSYHLKEVYASGSSPRRELSEEFGEFNAREIATLGGAKGKRTGKTGRGGSVGQWAGSSVGSRGPWRSA